MRFRKFQLSDLKDVINIEREAFPEPLSEIAIVFLSETCRILVAFKKKILGYLILGYEDRKTLHIYRIAISKNVRGEGIGRKFLSKYIRKKCRVIVRASNKNAIKFYEKYGFKQLDKIKGRKVLLEFNKKIT